MTALPLTPLAAPGRRHHLPTEDLLVLSEVAPASVIADSGDDPLELLSFGSMRETCPKCGEVHLRLVLRQTNVRAAHLFCRRCQSCFDAHYTDGRSAFEL